MATGRGRGTGKPRRRRPPPRIHTRLNGDESPFGVSQAVILAWIDQRTADPHKYGLNRYPDDVARVGELNRDLLDICLELGFVPYKGPAWAWERMSGRMDPGYADLLRRVKGLLDPAGIMNPGRVGLDDAQ
jgi:FAD/FMN-containing dehydrogenase